MNQTKIKNNHPFLEGKETTEEKSWSDYEKGHKEGDAEGYERGVTDFAEVERRKAKLRAKGIPVYGDTKMYEYIRKKLLDMVEAVKANPDIYEYIGITEDDIAEMTKELEALECPTYEVI